MSKLRTKLLARLSIVSSLTGLFAMALVRALTALYGPLPTFVRFSLRIIMFLGPPIAIISSILALVRIATSIAERKAWTLALIGLILGITSLHLTLFLFILTRRG